MGGLTWDTPPTEDELVEPSSTLSWDTPPTEDELIVEEEEYSQPSTLDLPDIGSTDEAGVYTPAMGEGGGTASPQDLQFEQDRMTRSDMGGDVEEISAATTSTWDVLRESMGSDEKLLTEAIKKRDTEREKMLLNKYGATTEVRGGKKVLVLENEDGTTRAMDYPSDGDILDTVMSIKGEMGGAVAGGVIGAGIGSMTGPAAPVAVPVLGAIGSAIGAYQGAGHDIDTASKEHNIPVTPEEKARLQKHAGVTDAIGSAVVASIGKVITKTAAKEFTSIANLPKKERQAIKHLQEQSGLSDAQMEQHIRQYGDITEQGTLPSTKAMEAASKGSEKEQTGYIIEAMNQDPKVKTKVIQESTDRSNEVGNALQRMSNELEDPAFANAYKRRTIDDEGRRKATNWIGLKDDLDRLAVSPDDPVYKMVADNVTSMGKKDTDIFQATVKAVKPDSKASEFIQPWTETTRGSVQTQRTATTFTVVDKILTHVFPNADKKAVDAIKKAVLAEGNNPKRLKEALVKQGIDDIKADRLAKELAESDYQIAKQAEKDAPKTAKAEATERKAINAGIAKDNKAREKSIAGKAKADQEAQATKVKEAKARETEYGKMADEEADRVANVEKDKLAKEAEQAKKDVATKKETHQAESAKWEDENTGLLKGKTKQYNLAKRKYEKSIGTADEAKNKTALDKIRTDATEARNTVLEKKAMEESENETVSAIEAGIKAEETEAQSVLTPKTAPKKRKATQNQIDAQKAKEVNPDDKEAIQKELFKKSPEVQTKKTAENATAKEAAELDNYTVSKKAIKKKVNKIDDMDDLGEVVRNTNSTDKERIEALRRRRAVASREAFGGDDLAVKYKEWADDSRSGFGDFIVEKKADLDLDYKKIEKYYEVQGTNVPPKVKKAYTGETTPKKQSAIKTNLGRPMKMRTELDTKYKDWFDNQKTAKQGPADFFTKSKVRRQELGLTAEDVKDFFGDKIPASVKKAYDL